MEIKKLGVIGVGSMGGMMSLLFAEHGVEVHFYDPSEDNVHLLLDHAKEAKVPDKIKQQQDYKELCESLDRPKIFVFSIPHGDVGDKTVEELRPYLEKGDIIVDASNEKWTNTERRPKKLDPDGIHYIGIGSLEDLRVATYASFLMAFTQGLHVINKADKEHGWNLSYTDIVQLWRGGCIIQSDHIADLLERVYERSDHDDDDLPSNREISGELRKAFPSLKNVVFKATEADALIPSLSASLEYYKYSGSTELPTQFMEAELDYFGGHMFDLKSAAPGDSRLWGSHHLELRPAKSVFDKGPEEP